VQDTHQVQLAQVLVQVLVHPKAIQILQILQVLQVLLMTILLALQVVNKFTYIEGDTEV